MKFLLGLLVVALLVFGVMTFFNLSEPANLGVKKNKLAALPDTPNAVSSQTDKEDRFVEPLPFLSDGSASLERIKDILAQMSGIFIVEESNGYLRAVAVSSLMRYRDDVEFFFDAESQLVHFRSASRIGHSDLGANRQRYDAIAHAYLNQTKSN
ncbi:MAG: DUF1499 domain-containing protein [Cohaesibacter sp.]|nr:DUF1499 domain-containing protein [Cohaesibacter sp.]